MSSLFPIRSTVDSRGDDEPRLLRLDSEDAGPVLDALSSDTARKVMAAVHEEPGTKSDLAERVDTSLQNVSYHLGNLEDAGLVEVVDTWYSSRGREMPVYGAAGGPVVVYAGDDDPSPDLRRALSSAVGALAVLGVLSGLVQWLFQQRPTDPVEVAFTSQNEEFDAATDGDAAAAPETTAGGMDAAGAGADDAARTTADVQLEAADAAEETAARTTEEALRAANVTTPTGSGDASAGLLANAGDWLASLPPGLLFFAGGTVVTLSLFAWWYVRQR